MEQTEEQTFEALRRVPFEKLNVKFARVDPGEYTTGRFRAIGLEGTGWTEEEYWSERHKMKEQDAQ